MLSQVWRTWHCELKAAEDTHHTRQTISVMFLMLLVFTKSRTWWCLSTGCFCSSCSFLPSFSSSCRRKTKSSTHVTQGHPVFLVCHLQRTAPLTWIPWKILRGAWTPFILAALLRMVSASSTRPWERSQRGDSGICLPPPKTTTLQRQQCSYGTQATVI